MPASFVRHVIGDFNGDGKPDIAAAFGSVSVYNGNGTLIPDAPVTFYDGNLGSATDIVTAFVNDDAFPDLVFAAGSQVGFLLNDAGAGFNELTFFSTSAPVQRIATGDFNNDGHLDVFVVYTDSAALYVWTENSGFQSAATFPFLNDPHDVVAGDFNLDSRLDVVLANRSTGIAYYRGNGDGTFLWPLAYSPGVALTPSELSAIDLDGDSDLDVVSANDSDISVTVWRNDVTTFTPVTYPVLRPPYTDTGRPTGLAIADFNGDTFLDIAVGVAKSSYLAVLTGNGDATFDEPSYIILERTHEASEGGGTLRALSAADMDLDGRVEILAEESRVGMFTIFHNLCGLAEVEAEAPPVISVGQTLVVPVTVAGEAEEAPTPTGTVTLKNGATVLDTETLVDGAATLEASGLPAGDYSLVVHYGGDTNFDAADSDPIPVTVTTETTSVAVTKSIPSSSWGQDVTFTATVTSTNTGGDPIEGTIELLIDGVVAATGDAPSFGYTTSTLPAGTHQITARYLGSEDRPPSGTSSPISHVVSKVDSEVVLNSMPSYVGGQAIIEALVNLPYTANATGTISLYEGSSLIAVIEAAIQPRIFTVGNLSMGTHYFTAVYTGDANVNGDTSPVYAHTVFFQASGLDASGGTSSVSVIWASVPVSATQSRLLRSTGNGGFSMINTFAASTRAYVDTSVSAGTVYRYMVEYLNPGGDVVGTTNIDTAQLKTFTNDGSLAGVTIRAAHFNEIRDAANTLRTAAGLAPISLTFSGAVQAAHVNTLRNAINEARTALGAPAFLWADTINAGVPIRAIHIQQLRDAVR